jgi:hypothetical protein
MSSMVFHFFILPSALFKGLGLDLPSRPLVERRLTISQVRTERRSFAVRVYAEHRTIASQALSRPPINLSRAVA